MFNSIINMAQEYPGSNNLPVLVPEGQFGTRLAGGSDAASPRYIFTRLQPWTRLVFPAADDPVLALLLEVLLEVLQALVQLQVDIKI